MFILSLGAARATLGDPVLYVSVCLSVGLHLCVWKLSEMNRLYLCQYSNMVLETAGEKWVKSTGEHSVSLLRSHCQTAIVSVKFSTKRKTGRWEGTGKTQSTHIPDSHPATVRSSEMLGRIETVLETNENAVCLFHSSSFAFHL